MDRPVNYRVRRLGPYWVSFRPNGNLIGAWDSWDEALLSVGRERFRLERIAREAV